MAWSILDAWVGKAEPIGIRTRDMKTIHIYDPPMCCSTGLCGTQIDPALVSFAALLTELRQKGVRVERYNLSQQPMAFVENPAVKGLLEAESTKTLPVILVDGEIFLKGRYPTQPERLALSQTVLSESYKAAP